jgi:phasin
MTAQARTGTAPEALRDLAERGAAQAKENLETMSAAAGQATDFLKQNYTTTVKGAQDYNTKILEFTNANIKAAVEQATKLMTVKSPMEFFALSSDYAKQQFGILTRQAQELAAIVQNMTMPKDR